jgi:hypothetical protein
MIQVIIKSDCFSNESIPIKPMPPWAYLLTPQRVNDLFLVDLTTGAGLVTGVQL